MRSPKTIGTLGIVVALLPYAGVPGAWYRPAVLVCGLVISFLALRMFISRTSHTVNHTMQLPFDQSSEQEAETIPHAP